MAENPKLPLVVRSLLGRLELQVQNQPDRTLTGEQVTTLNWLLEEAKLGFSHRPIQLLPPLGAEEALTATDLLAQVEALAKAMGL